MSEWEEETVYHDGDRFFSELGRAISGARETVNFETYIFDRDVLGRKILKRLRAAARRGVRVRLLLDGVGCSQWSYQQLGDLERAGVQVRFFHPLPWQHRNYRFWRFWTLRRALLGLWKLNRRNHRKSCVIDGDLAFLGGMNVSARHLKSSSGRHAWRDTSVRVRGKPLRQLELVFDHAWTHTRSVSRRLKSSTPAVSIRSARLRLNLTRRARVAAYKDLIRRILSAKERVWITNPYFVPELALIRALRLAAWAGTDVRILLPSKNDIWGLKWAIKAFYFVLLSAHVRIFEYVPSILHAKIVLLDDWAMVGSSNLNHRSLLHDLEVDVVLSRKESLHSIEERFLRDLSLSKEIDVRSWRKRPWVGRLLGRLALLFRRWM